MILILLGANYLIFLRLSFITCYLRGLDEMVSSVSSNNGVYGFITFLHLYPFIQQECSDSKYKHERTSQTGDPFRVWYAAFG